MPVSIEEMHCKTTWDTILDHLRDIVPCTAEYFLASMGAAKFSPQFDDWTLTDFGELLHRMREQDTIEFDPKATIAEAVLTLTAEGFAQLEKEDRQDDMIRGKWLMDEAETLEEAAKMLETEAKRLRRLARLGFRLLGPVEDDYGRIRKGGSK